MHRQLFLLLLYMLNIFLGVGAFAGGGMLLIRPDGSLLGMDPGWLDHSPFAEEMMKRGIKF